MKSLEQVFLASKNKLASVLVAGSLAVGGCASIRMGNYPSPTFPTTYFNLEELGVHGTPNEKNGIVYTRDGGHIDIAHARICADFTRDIALKFYSALMEEKNSFEIYYEKNNFIFEIKYPRNWSLNPNKHDISLRISRGVAPRYSYDIATWHEIATWFGLKTTGIFPEFQSSFSWEDNYSNLLGALVGLEAIKRSGDYNKNATDSFKEAFIELGIQQKEIARAAGDAVAGKWFDYSITEFGFADMKKRHLDIGLDNGYVTPWIVPGICAGAKPRPLPVPSIDFIKNYGFDIRMLIEPRFSEKRRIYEVLNLNNESKIIPEQHFRKLMEEIKREAICRYKDPNCDKP